MKEKLLFTNTNQEKLFKNMLEGKFKENSIFNFLNSNSIYLLKKHKVFREHVLRRNNINFIDGFMISFFSSIKYMKFIKRVKGTSFSDSLLNNYELIKNKKHLFIGLSRNDLNKVVKKYPLLKKQDCFNYDVPFLKEERFNDSEIIRLINKINPYYVWVSIGNPKQEILSNDLSDKVKVNFFFNVGAFFDYVRDKKKQSPKFFQIIGLEWFYRLITDSKHTWNKVKRSFIANKYLFNSVEVK
jgi:N-acetylglucosaminyldiphosphoundecaprenol N-acetyl-beta-D-mannosaminyltransferase